MVKTFKDERLKILFETNMISKSIPPDISKRLLRSLIAVNEAENILDLRIPPSNHLEVLSGNREGQYSIRINDKWRLCFRWIEKDAYDIELIDYHGGKRK